MHHPTTSGIDLAAALAYQATVCLSTMSKRLLCVCLQRADLIDLEDSGSCKKPRRLESMASGDSLASGESACVPWCLALRLLHKKAIHERAQVNACNKKRFKVGVLVMLQAQRRSYWRTLGKASLTAMDCCLMFLEHHPYREFQLQTASMHHQLCFQLPLVIHWLCNIEMLASSASFS